MRALCLLTNLRFEIKHEKKKSFLNFYFAPKKKKKRKEFILKYNLALKIMSENFCIIIKQQEYYKYVIAMICSILSLTNE